MEETSSNLEGNKKDNLNIKNILKNENLDDMLLDMDDEDYQKIKNELNAYKQKREKEIEILENELKRLKDEKAKYENLKEEEEDDDIILDENLKNQIKEEIINQIKPKIDEELKKNQSEINKKLENMEKDNKGYIEKKFNKFIIPKYQKLQDSIKKNDKNNQNMREKDKIIEQNKEPDFKSKIKKNINYDRHPNLNQNNYCSIKNNEIEQDEQNNSINNNYFNINKNNEKPIVIIQNNTNNTNNNNSIQQKASTNIQKKLTIQNLFLLFNPIFFKNKEQTSVNGEKINEERREKIRLVFFKYRMYNQHKELINYFDNFARANVLKYLQSSKISQKTKENLRYNIETVLECLEVNKYSYKEFYYPQNNKNPKDPTERKKSTEAASKFRRVFNVNNSIINDDELVKKLESNNNDINKVFQLIYG